MDSLTFTKIITRTAEQHRITRRRKCIFWFFFTLCCLHENISFCSGQVPTITTTNFTSSSSQLQPNNSNNIAQQEQPSPSSSSQQSSSPPVIPTTTSNANGNVKKESEKFEPLPQPLPQVSRNNDFSSIINQQQQPTNNNNNNNQRQNQEQQPPPPPFSLPQQQQPPLQQSPADRERDRNAFTTLITGNNPFDETRTRDRDRLGTTDRNNNNQNGINQDRNRITSGDNNNLDQFGRPRNGQLDQFGRPRQDLDQFGRPRNEQVDQFGRPRQDLDQFGRPRQDVDQFGRPRQDLDQFGRTTRPDLDQFGRPRNERVDQFGRPIQEFDQFGRPITPVPDLNLTTTTTPQPGRPFIPPVFATTTTTTTTLRPPSFDPPRFPGQDYPGISNTTRRPTPFSPFGRPQFPVDPFGSFNRPYNPNISPNDPFGIYRTPGSPSYNPALGPGIPGYGIGSGGYSDRGRLYREPRYFIVASNMVRPGQIYRIIVTVYQTQLQPNEIEVRASLLHDGVDIGSDMKQCQLNVPETLMILVPKTSVEGHYRLRVEGNDNGLVGGTAFVNETDVRFSLRAMTIFIQTDKPVYMQGQTVRFRAIPINRHLRAFDDAVDVYMLDPRGNINRRWLSRQSNFGAVSLNYTLSDQPIYGNWTIRVQALNQIEEKLFWVEEYYQPRFEVNVTMPAFYFSTEEYLSGIVVANFTSGGPVQGNLTLSASVKPIDTIYYQAIGGSIYEAPLIQQYEPYFNGYYEFRFPLTEIERAINLLDNVEVTITASVGEHFWNEKIEGYSKARIYNSTLRLTFLGGSPQVFKPAMTYNCYLSVSYQDGSPLYLYRLWKSRMEIQAEVQMMSGQRQRLEPRYEVRMLQDSPGIWKVSFNLKQELAAGEGRIRQTLNLVNEVHSLRVQAVFTNPYRESATSELLVVAHYSPRNRHIRVASSTTAPKVGEYVVFHVRGNFYFERFTYVIMSKGVILLSGHENMDSTIKTFAISVSPEMAPAATIVVYYVSKYMDVVTDSLTFPVDGLSRNNFTVVINNKKEKTNNIVEVIIRGQPGAYVGLSGVDAAFYSMQAGNEISYGEVLSQMINFDEDSNGTLIQKWISREGLPDEVVYFPQHSLGIDANRTFTYTGLIVFSDTEIPRRGEYCNETAGQYACYTGNQCYHIDKKCDYFRDCLDGTDESNCPWYNATDLLEFKLYRFSRMQRLYDNVWLWKDGNIGPHGHFIFSLPVPERPAMWMVSALGVSPTTGFGLLRAPLRYSGVRPLFINVEMPTKCRQGEQIGIRVTVFNYMMKDIEVRVLLADSSDYKFIHVGEDGIVPHYNPITSYGEHQHLVWIRAQDTVQVHFPIVATKLGKVIVTVHAVTLIARDKSVNILQVDPDGVPQFRHTAMLLDLSNRAYVLQFMHINVTESPEIPYETERYYVYSSNLAEISVVGDVVGPAYPTMPVNATSLLKKPMESAENNIFSFAANLYTLMYLRLTSQRDRVIYREAFHNLNVLYQRQLSFQTEEGAFSLYRSDWNHSNPSVWTTAFCARVLAEANFNEWENFLYIDPQVIARAVDWVIKFQTLEGSFYEVSEYANRKINDTVVHEDWSYSPNITLTAHVLIALHVVRDLPGAVGPRLAFARQRAIMYLESKVDDMKYTQPRPYDTALVAYALMLSKSPKADAAFIVLSGQAQFEGGYAYWGRETIPLPDYKLENNKPFLLPRLPYNYDSENIETTAYALMVYVARQEIRVESIVKWLNSQRLYDGGWASTQDTAAAMRSLIDYTIRQKIRNVTDIRVTVESVAIPGIAHTFHVTPERLAIPQSIYIENAFGTVNVEAKGAGYAILNMKVQYGVDRPRFITQPPMPAFTLEVYSVPTGRNSSYIEYRSCQSWTLLNESERSGMAVLEVNIPTGYFIHQPKLDEYVLSFMVPTLKRAKYLMDKVVFYFDYLEINPTCVNFTVERWFPVANMTRYLPMRVYDYYAPERYNETLFDSLDTYVLDICRVCGSYQCPYCPIFASAPTIATLSPAVISTMTFISIVLIYSIFKT